MSRFDIQETPLQGLFVLQRKPIGDQRGYLERIFCQTELAEIWEGLPIRQINRTLTKKKGTMRGMHFQCSPHAEKKLITCLRGLVFDVAVDLRKGSPTFLQHYTIMLSEDRQVSLMIPEGFAHGFQTLTDDCELLYLHSADYAPEFEAGLNGTDPILGVIWPEEISGRSERDSLHAMISADFSGIEVI